MKARLIGFSCVSAALAADHPDDPAQYLVPLLRRVVLEPGDALFVSPGMLHTTFRGSPSK